MNRFNDLKNTIELIDQNIDNMQSFIEKLAQDDPGFFDPTKDMYLVGIYKAKIGWYKEAINDFEKLDSELTSCIPSLLICYCYYKLEDENNFSLYLEKVSLISREIKESDVKKDQLIEDYLCTKVLIVKNYLQPEGITIIIPESIKAVELIKKEMYKEAISELFNMFELLNKLFIANIFISYCYLRLKDYDNALMYYHKQEIESKIMNNNYIKDVYKEKNELTKSNNTSRKYRKKPRLLDEKYEFGIDYINQKQFDKALIEFIDALGYSPDFYFHHLNVGYCYFKIKEYKQASEYYNNAFDLKSDQDFFEKMFELHSTYSESTNYSYSDYIIDLQELLENTPNNKLFTIALGDAFFQHEKFQEACVAVNKYISMASSINRSNQFYLYNILFHSYTKLNDFNNAHKALIKIAETNPDFYNNKYDFCLDHFDKHYFNCNQNLYFHPLNIAYCYFRLNKPEEAYRYYTKAFKLNSSSAFFHSMAKLFSVYKNNKHSYMSFKNNLNNLLEIYSNCSICTITLGYVYCSGYEWQKAIDLMENLLSKSDSFQPIDKFHINNILLKSYTALQSDYKDSLATKLVFEEILKVDPTYQEGKEANFIEDFTSVFSELEEEIGCKPEFYFYYLNLGYYYFRLEKYQEAEIYYTKAFKLNSSKKFFVEIYKLHACFCEKQERYDYKAYIIELNTFIENTPDSEVLILALGYAFNEEKTYLNAIHTANKLIESSNSVMKETTFNAYSIIAFAYTELKDFLNAKNAALKLIEIDPANALSYYLLAVILVKSEDKDLDMLEDLINNAIELYPDNFELYNNLAYYYRAKGDTEKVIKLSKKAIELEPRDPLAYQVIGFEYYKQKKYDRSKEYYYLSNKIDFDGVIYLMIKHIEKEELKMQ